MAQVRRAEIAELPQFNRMQVVSHHLMVYREAMPHEPTEVLQIF